MARYRIKAFGWVEDDTDSDTPTFEPSLEVDGPAEIDTGLITESGDRIYRMPLPIGFGRCEDW
jgi:hypothetical protein